MLAVTPILAAEWVIEADEDAPSDAREFIDEQFMEKRQPLLQPALLHGYVDFGFQPFEKVFEATTEGRVGLRKIKPLIQDHTKIQVDDQTGAFEGFRQGGEALAVEYCLLYSFGVEGTNWGGQPLLENIRETWWDWKQANDGAVRYDRKVAGSHFVVHFPKGVSEDITGQEVDNSEIANTILASLESSGGIAIPRTVAAYVSDLSKDEPAWVIEILSDGGGQQPTFIDRLQYLDVNLIRGLILPERAVLEGKHGTLAEAGEHGDLALTNAELLHEQVTRTTNWYAVDQLLAINWGDEARGTVRLVAAPIQDTKRAFLREVYKHVLTDPSGFLEEFGALDTEALRDALGVPSLDEGDRPDEPEVVPVEGVDANDPDAEIARGVFQAVGEGDE
jgi:hypothetical protein